MAKRRRAQPTKAYRWRAGVRMRADPQAAGARLDEMLVSLGRALTPEDVLAESQRKDSPFHTDVWRDDAGAAESKWRLTICGRILRGIETVTITYEDETREPVEVATPVVIRLPGVGYAQAESVLRAPETRAVAMTEIVSQLRYLRDKLRRYDTIAKLLDATIAEAQRLGTQAIEAR